MPTEILMPALSPTMEEGTLARWLVKEGDSVSSGDLLAEIETDKATMEFEAVDEGTIAQILVDEGTEGVKVGTVIARILDPLRAEWYDGRGFRTICPTRVATEMLEDALNSFVSKDPARARSVVERDSVVDACYAETFPALGARMASEPETSQRLLSVGRYLERIADHATNIAEMVVFMVEGKDVRHTFQVGPIGNA